MKLGPCIILKLFLYFRDFKSNILINHIFIKKSVHRWRENATTLADVPILITRAGYRSHSKQRMITSRCLLEKGPFHTHRPRNPIRKGVNDYYAALMTSFLVESNMMLC